MPLQYSWHDLFNYNIPCMNYAISISLAWIMSLKYSLHDLFNYNIPGMNYAISISLA
jgi:hypothetical protein